MAELDRFIDRAKHLPPAPTLLPELLKLLGQPNVDGSRIVRLITYDPAMTAKVLRLCNSAVFAAATPVTDLDEAVVRIGFDEIYRLVAASSGVHRLKATGPKQATLEKQLWAHSAASAVGAQLVARSRGADENLAFTAGLLHDIGKLVLLDVQEEKYVKLIEELETQRYSAIDMETRLFGLQHAELGGRLLARWRFPMNMVASVIFQHNPLAAAGHQVLAAQVCLGNAIAYLLGYGWGDAAAEPRGRQEALNILKVDKSFLSQLIEVHPVELETVRTLIEAGS